MRSSFTTSLLQLALLFSALGCYTNIPAVSMEPICRIVRETHKSNEYRTVSRVGQERITVGSEAIAVYFDDSVDYSYDVQGRILHEQKRGTNNSTDTKYSYTGSRLNSEWIAYTKDGLISQVYSSSLALNERGYDARRSYDGDDIPLPSSGVRIEKRIDGNIIHQVVDNVDRTTTLNYTYDLTRLSRLNPRQFEGRFSRNLLLTESNSGYSCCGPRHIEYQYQFDSENHVRRQIRVVWSGELTDGLPPETIYVTDYEYNCQ